MQNQGMTRENDFQTNTISGGLKFSEIQMSVLLDKQYEGTKSELKGLFTTSEAWLIVNSLSGLPDSLEQTAKIIVSGYVQDTVYFGSEEELYGVDGEKLLNKLHELTEFQAFTVLNMVREFINIELDSESNHESEDLLNEIFMVSEIENEEICLEGYCDCEMDNFEFSWELGFQKLRHIGTVFALKFGIFIAIRFDEGEFTLYEDCEDCGELHFLESYSIDELIELDVMEEVKYLIEENFTDED